ncbi:TetR/AcrR family transcriptional regulator [Tumebacillus sp. ITR2]|uniref:TetR/AcrR family transcriptional regulator n=1 Tax=Tumebacillus amylolyticus TaxID=2801339 RepID=A0ABS1JD83_9BACL|nr:TetR/AcrR family transcriptional regulator [Tumebacillus amylolyticus]MBL0388242.1 TetR/AcrR family transcriptional regulator [Tumebacillus amylolyticus]
MRSDETKRRILEMAAHLFAERGFEKVTMREIAKAAGCSHTTIYIYYKDKEALLHRLSMPPMQDLRDQFSTILQDQAMTPVARVKSISRTFLDFCFANRNLYTVFFMTRASRVDEVDPEALRIQKLRLELFGQLRQGIRDCLPPGQSEDSVLAYTRVYFFTLHGIMGTYQTSEEPLDALFARLAPTFDLAVDVMLAGFQQIVVKGEMHR